MNFTAQELQQIRLDTPGADLKIHLNNAGASLPPQIVVDTMVEYLQLEAQIGGYEAAEVVADQAATFYTSLAKFLNAHPRNIAYQTSATDAYTKALTSIPLKKGDAILTTTNDYASNFLAFLQLKKERGIQIILAADTPSGEVDLSSIEALIQQHRPRVVAITHIPTNSGLVQPAAEIGTLCRQYEVWYLLDACQTAGQLPIDVNEFQCDFLSATFRKYMRGPRGAGFLYVSDRVLDKGLAPLFVDLKSANWSDSDQYTLHSEAKRFEWWERSYALKLAAQKAIDYALEIGLEKIEARVKQLAGYCRNSLLKVPGLQIMDLGEKRCGIVSFHLPGYTPDQLKEQFRTANINVSTADRSTAVIDMDHKGVDWVVRLSPHYYNLQAEIDEAVKQLMVITAS